MHRAVIHYGNSGNDGHIRRSPFHELCECIISVSSVPAIHCKLFICVILQFRIKHALFGVPLYMHIEVMNRVATRAPCFSEKY